MPRWTAEQQHELAGLLADIKGPWAAAFREFNKRVSPIEICTGRTHTGHTRAGG